METLALQSLTAFGAGLLASLSPCVYPMIPISMGYLGANSSSGKRLTVLTFFLGQVAAFTGLGFLAVQLGEVFGFSSELPWLNLAIGFLLLGFGAMSFFNYMPAFLGNLNNYHLGFERRVGNRLLFGFIVGVSSALIASPCTSPILGSLLGVLAQAKSSLVGIWLMFLYALGMSLIFLGLGLGLVEIRRLPRSGQWLSRVHHLSSFLVLLGGAYFLVKGISLW